MTKHFTQVLVEERVTDKRLGRNINFDEQSSGFRIAATLEPLEWQRWRRYTKALDQGDLGSCTGNAAVGALATVPLHLNAGSEHRPPTYTQPVAISVYSEATRLDPFWGTYPPTDTGSDILSVMKVLRSRGWITSFDWAFNIQEMLVGLSYKAPAVAGVYWYSGFDEPNSEGKVTKSGSIRGGHAFEVVGFSQRTGYLECVNSWGASYGRKGRFFIKITDFAELIEEDGEVAFPIQEGY